MALVRLAAIELPISGAVARQADNLVLASNDPAFALFPDVVVLGEFTGPRLVRIHAAGGRNKCCGGMSK